MILISAVESTDNRTQVSVAVRRKVPANFNLRLPAKLPALEAEAQKSSDASGTSARINSEGDSPKAQEVSDSDCPACVRDAMMENRKVLDAGAILLWFV